jgi:membrane-associated phospholipid phosphatase
MPHRHTAISLIATLLLIFLARCASTPAPSPQNVVEQPAAVQQQPALLADKQVLRVPDPPPLDSPQLDLEIAELQALRSSLTDEQKKAINAWDSGAVLHWNKLARDLVARYALDPLTASRVYLLLSTAQYDALRIADEYQRHFDRQMPQIEGVTPLITSRASAAYPSEHATLAAASAAVLTEFFPGELPALEAQRAEEQESRLWAGVNCRSDILAGDTLGREIAARLLEQSRADLGAVSWAGDIPTGAGTWVIDDKKPAPPLAPEWGKLKPWLMEKPDQFRASPPPTFDSPEFKAALAEVRKISNTRTDEQLRIAKFWADGKGTPTPPGHWNRIAADLIAERKLGDLEAARVMTYLNMALYDAGISAWDTKYAYWLIRPFNVDPAITTPVGRPNHPSYVSGHSTFSGAAAEFLGAVFPEKATELTAMAEEASLSRVYGGIHYRFDCDAGIEAGRAIGRLAAARMKAE